MLFRVLVEGVAGPFSPLRLRVATRSRLRPLMHAKRNLDCHQGSDWFAIRTVRRFESPFPHSVYRALFQSKIFPSSPYKLYVFRSALSAHDNVQDHCSFKFRLSSFLGVIGARAGNASRGGHTVDACARNLGLRAIGLGKARIRKRQNHA